MKMIDNKHGEGPLGLIKNQILNQAKKTFSRNLHHNLRIRTGSYYKVS